MRIVGGKFRGRVLASFKGKDVRPTSDRAKEALFNILAPEISGANVLDLFCGTGGIGLEALSRGADLVVFNDVSADSLAILRKNLALLRTDAKIYNLDYAAPVGSDRRHVRRHLYRPAVQERVRGGCAPPHRGASAAQYGRRRRFGERSAVGRGDRRPRAL